jgi:ParB-like chromosome segregation protein Spo0J
METKGYRLAMFPLAACNLAGNIRVAVDEEELRLLGESLRKRQIHPIVVLADGTVLDGGKRVRAALAAGLTDLLAVVSDEPLTPGQIVELQLISAFHRSDPSPFDKWRAMEAVVDGHPDWSNRQVAGLLDIDPKMVKVLLSPGRCIEAAREALREGKIGISTCHELSLLPPEEQGPLLALKLSGSSRDEVARRARKQRSGPPGGVGEAKLGNLKITLHYGGETATVVVKGARSLADVAEILKDARKRVEEADRKGWDARTLQKVSLQEVGAGVP